MLARRSVLASALALPACASTGSRIASVPRGDCLPPVNVDPGRVIRTMAGLRPYRASGFVVRAEALGDTRLIHNYGHGGGGITLSWGTSRLATALGLPGHSGAVAVIGSGAVGLANARLAQEAGFKVTLYTKALPPETTSNIAGGQVAPTSVFEAGHVSPEWLTQYRAAMAYSWRRFQIMVGEDYGIRWVPTWQPAMRGFDADDPEAFLLSYQPAQTQVPAGRHPFGARAMRHFDTMYVETGRYLRQMLADFHVAGGRVEVREFASPAELTALPEKLVFNCTGLGSNKLFGDRELVPVRGQLAILLPQPEIRYAYAGSWGYMFPRPDGIVLGGTFEQGEWDATPQPNDIARILRQHAALARDWRCTT